MQWKEEHPLRYQSGEQIRAQYVIQTLGELTGGNAIVVTDVGQHQMWAAQFFTLDRIPARISPRADSGRWASRCRRPWARRSARTDLPVVSISGDGGFQMNMQEMATIVQHKLPIKIFVINNGFLGMVRQWQELFWRRRYSQVELANPDFVKLAEAYGCPAVPRRRSTDEVEDAIRESAGAHRRADLRGVRRREGRQRVPDDPRRTDGAMRCSTRPTRRPASRAGAEPPRLIVLHKGELHAHQQKGERHVPVPARAHSAQRRRRRARTREKRHTISVLVENKFGAFNRIAGMFAAKGYNIDSLTRRTDGGRERSRA